MRNIFLILAAALLVVPTSVRGQDPNARDEASLLAVLRSDTPAANKAMACKFLAVYGSSESVPELAPLLADEQLASWARIALEAIPGPAADEALRKATDSLQGKLLVGVINSIGVRRDLGAVDSLVERLQNPDIDVASAAAVALGRIGNSAAVKSLRNALASAPVKVRAAVAEGCVLCAERFLSEGKSGEATEIYDEVRKADVPQPRILEATRGAILARGQDGIPVLLEQLRSPDEKLFQIALTTAREFPGRDFDQALANELDRAAPDRAALLVQAMADRKDTVALPALLVAAGRGPKQVRIAAITALGRVGDVSCVPALLKIGLDPDAELADPAKAALAELPDEKVGQEIIVGLPKAQGAAYVLLLELVGRRRIEAVDALVKALDHSDKTVRSAALTSLGNTVPAERISLLISQVVAPQHAEDQPVAVRALKAASIRLPDREKCAAELAMAIDRSPLETKIALLEILGAVGGSNALATIGAAARSSDVQLKDISSRLLGEWMTIDAAPVLLDLAKTGPADKYQGRALRGYIRIARQFTMPDEERVEMCKNALDVSRQPAEKKLVLDVLKRNPNPETLKLALQIRSVPELKEDATQATLAIAENLGSTPDELAKLFSKDGLAKVKLEIVKAEYGAGTTLVDVTETLQKQVADFQLIMLPSSNYNATFGGDPAPGLPKELKIQYRIDGKSGAATFAENALIFLPQPK